jgi:hypothetical protein
VSFFSTNTGGVFFVSAVVLKKKVVVPLGQQMPVLDL